MLKGAISRAYLIMNDARQHLSTREADAVEKVYINIEKLNDFINKGMDRIDKDPKLSYRERSAARRAVIEHAGRKLEIFKDRSHYSDLIQESDTRIPYAYGRNDNPIVKFMREREIRDRLFGMTEAQILSYYGESLFDGRNQLLLNAILNAPPGFEVLSERNLRKLRRIKTENRIKTGARPGMDRSAKASILEIFSLAKKELDRLRKNELALGRTKM